MTSLSNIRADKSKILNEASWLIEDGFKHEICGDYTLNFTKSNITIEIYYGRYCDPTDVLISIDSPQAERRANGSLVQYSVFEGFLRKDFRTSFSSLDGYDVVQIGFDIIREKKEIFDIEYLQKTREIYLQKLRDNTPKRRKGLASIIFFLRSIVWFK
jgi:hypothetical protein